LSRDTYGWYADADSAFCRALWCVVRHTRPEVVIETGVAHGVTSRVVLEAILGNDFGHLWSIDLPFPFDHRLHGETGIVVTDACSARWFYIEGSSKERLPPLVADVGPCRNVHPRQCTLRITQCSRWSRRPQPCGVLMRPASDRRGAGRRLPGSCGSSVAGGGGLIPVLRGRGCAAMMVACVAVAVSGVRVMLAAEVVAVATRPVTLTDILDGHKVLDISCLDRIYLNGYVPGLMTSGQLVGFLAHRGFPIPSPAAVGKNGNAFGLAMSRYAETNGIPLIRFAKGDRKIDVVRPLLAAAERDGRSKVVAIGVAQEFQWAWDAVQKDMPGGAPRFSWYRADKRVTCYYAYLWDDRMGPGFIKVCAYAPYPEGLGQRP